MDREIHGSHRDITAMTAFLFFWGRALTHSSRLSPHILSSIAESGQCAPMPKAAGTWNANAESLPSARVMEDDGSGVG